MSSELVNPDGSTGNKITIPKFTNKELKDADDVRGNPERGFYTHGKISLKNYCHIKSPLQKTLF